ncbi:MAG: 50S ribosomal protein L11 methyltransferase, partial [Clostridia bacterium]|nr:50S ribosomal protein L11 methyltransferase [Clostridia bacterium]
MDWLKVKIFTTHAGCEIVSASLYAMGIYGLEIFDPEDYKMPDKDYTWDYIDDEVLEKQKEEAYVVAYIGDNAAGFDQLSEIKGYLARLPKELPEFDLGRLEVTLTNIQNEDWVNNWKKFFSPIEVGKRFLIVPEWEKVENTEDKLILTINPGGIFGTGSHETTQLCIAQIEKA